MCCTLARCGLWLPLLSIMCMSYEWRCQRGLLQEELLPSGRTINWRLTPVAAPHSAHPLLIRLYEPAAGGASAARAAAASAAGAALPPTAEVTVTKEAPLLSVEFKLLRDLVVAALGPVPATLSATAPGALAPAGKASAGTQTEPVTGPVIGGVSNSDRSALRTIHEELEALYQRLEALGVRPGGSDGALAGAKDQQVSTCPALSLP